MANEIDVKDLPALGYVQQGDKVVTERVPGVTSLGTIPYNVHVGTANRVTITNGDGAAGNPTYDISSSYVGQSSITTLGTLTAAVWNATTISVSYGGNGRASATAYAPIVGGVTSTGAHQSSPTGSVGQLYVSQGASAIPIWTTPVYPTASGTAGKILQANGTDIVYSTATWPTAATLSKFLTSDGTNYVESTSTIPTSAGATANKHLKSNGTNYVLTTATISDTPSTAGKRLVSDGTNWATSTTTMPDTGALGKFLVGDGTNYVDSTSKIPTSAGATANKLLLSNGTDYVLSTPTFPNASATTRKMIVSDGTNWTASTETHAAPGTSGNILQSDGTNWVTLASTGTGSNVCAGSPTITTPIINGVATNSSAAAGVVGEVIESIVTGVAITSGVITNITSISVTAGDWDLQAEMTTQPGGSTITTALLGSIGSTSATLATRFSSAAAISGAGTTNGVSVVLPNVKLTGTTTYFLVGFATYSTSTLTMTGQLTARRRR